MNSRNRYAREHRRGGMVAIYVALALLPIVGIMALVIDIGIARARQSHVQASADAAALAAAVELFHHSRAVARGIADPGGAARAAAAEILQANGYSNANSEIIINIPPRRSESGFNGKLGYAEVVLIFQQQRYFSAIYGSEDISIGARAIARGGARNFAEGVVALDRHKDKAFSINGNGGVEVHAGSIFVNSDSEEAYVLSGNASAEADSHEVAGDTGQSGNAGFVGPVHTGVPPVPDPFRHLPQPDPGDYPVRATSKTKVGGNTEAVLLPGVYEGGIEVSANGFATLLPGIYIMRGGGFEFSGNGGVEAAGVMIYNMSGSDGEGIKITGNGSVTLTPPTVGPYQGVSLFQQRSQTDQLQLSGNGDMLITGLVYAPAAEIKITGNGSSDIYGGTIIGNSYDISGNGTVTVDVNGSLAVAGGRPRLVE